MGWLWFGKAQDAVTPADPQPTSHSTQQQPEVPFLADQSAQSPTAAEQSSTTIPRTLSREEQANQDLLEILKEFQVEQESSRSTSKTTTNQSGSIISQALQPQPPTDISPESLYPSEIFCRSAFDYALFCQSFGGQFVNIYRYGSFRSCSNHWQDFWLCMRTRNWDRPDREREVREHYRKKAVKYRTGPSSEDVWEVRTEPVKDAFQDSLEELEKRIEDWKRKNPDVEDPWDKQSGVTFKNVKKTA